MTDKIIHVKVHPAVKKYLESHNTVTKDGIILKDKLTKEEILCYVSIKGKKIPSKISKKLESFPQTTILVNDWNFFQFGYEIEPYWQYRLSKRLYMRMMEEIATRIEIYTAKSMTKMQAVEDYYNENNITYEELNPSTVIKHYQRHFQK